MDKTPVCGTGTSGSTPGESTTSKRPSGRFDVVLERNHLVLSRVEKSEYIARTVGRTIRTPGQRVLMTERN